MFQFAKTLDSDLCKNNPNAFIVFGDNLICKGKAGEAIIRDEINAFGVPTKRLPSMDSHAFFSDKEDEYLAVKNKLIFLWTAHTSGKNIILPESQIGTGLAKLNIYSPKINELISRFYASVKNVVSLNDKASEIILFAKNKPELWDIIKEANKDKIHELKRILD